MIIIDYYNFILRHKVIEKIILKGVKIQMAGKLSPSTDLYALYSFLFFCKMPRTDAIFLKG